jgi:hypothetical protein
MDYLNEVPIWKEKIDQADVEMAQYEAEIQDLTQQEDGFDGVRAESRDRKNEEGYGSKG